MAATLQPEKVLYCSPGFWKSKAGIFLARCRHYRGQWGGGSRHCHWWALEVLKAGSSCGCQGKPNTGHHLSVIRTAGHTDTASPLQTLICPHLEYGNIVWGNFNKEDQHLVERVQCQATHLVCNLWHLSYQSQVSPNLGFRIWCNALKNPTNGMPDKIWHQSYLASHWSDYSGYCIIA